MATDDTVECEELKEHVDKLTSRLSVNGLPHGACYDVMRAMTWSLRHHVTRRSLDRSVRQAVRAGIDDALARGLAAVGDGRRRWTPAQIGGTAAAVGGIPSVCAVLLKAMELYAKSKGM